MHCPHCGALLAENSPQCNLCYAKLNQGAARPLTAASRASGGPTGIQGQSAPGGGKRFTIFGLSGGAVLIYVIGRIFMFWDRTQTEARMKAGHEQISIQSRANLQMIPPPPHQAFIPPTMPFPGGGNPAPMIPPGMARANALHARAMDNMQRHLQAMGRPGGPSFR